MSVKHRNYEALYIVKPTLSDSEINAIAERYKTVVTDHGGTVESAGKWDKRKLAYPVSGFKEGAYILMLFAAGPEVPAELDRLMRINDDVLRQLIIVVEKKASETKEEAPKPARKPKVVEAEPAAEPALAE